MSVPTKFDSLLDCRLLSKHLYITQAKATPTLTLPTLNPPTFTMAFYQVPCFDVMELVGKHVAQQRQEITAGFWKHNGSNMRLVNNQINNIILALEKRGKRITPKQAHPKTQYKYVGNSAELAYIGGVGVYVSKGMHVVRPKWGTSTWNVGSVRMAYYPTAEDYIVDKTEECAINPRLTWALPARYGCYSAWKAKYLD